MFCLAMAVYHEARSEPLAGQVAVAMVIMNRVNSVQFPDDVCSVVTEPDQFPFNWAIPRETMAWEQAVMIADRVLAGDITDMTKGALHYHRDDIRVSWTENMIAQHIGDRHIFWKASSNWSINSRHYEYQRTRYLAPPDVFHNECR